MWEGADIQMDEFGHTDTSDTTTLLPTADETPFDTYTPPATTFRGDNVGEAETSFGGDNTEIDTYGNPMDFPYDTGGGDNADDTGGGDNADDTGGGDNADVAGTSFGDNTDIDTHGDWTDIPLDTEATGGGDNADVAGTSFGNDNTGIGTHGDDIDFPDTPMGEPGMIAGDNIENLRDILNSGTIEDARKLVVKELFKTFKIKYGFDPPPPPPPRTPL